MKDCVSARGRRRDGRGAAAACLAACLSVSACLPDAGMEEILCSRVGGPVFLGVKAVEADLVELSFSEPVSILSLRFDPALEVAAVQDGAKTVAVRLPGALAEGGRYAVDVAAEDGRGNRLDVLAFFRGRNPRPPALRIMEIRTEYSKPKVEFVEMLALTDGQLGGLALRSSGGGGEAPLYEFPPAEVRAGELVVLHLRTLEEGCVDEAAAEIVSGGLSSTPGRDFWLAGSDENLRKSDALVLEDQDGAILDAVVFTDDPAAPWREGTEALAARMALAGAWKTAASGGADPGSPEAAASNAGSTPTKTLCRSEGAADTDTAADWSVAAKGGATPGLPNVAPPSASKRKARSSGATAKAGGVEEGGGRTASTEGP